MMKKTMAAMIAASITLAAPAHADDDTFWSALKVAGLDSMFPRNLALSKAKTLCDTIRKGDDDPMGEAVDLVEKGFTADQAGEFVGIAIHEYCPDQGAKIGEP